MLALAFGLLGLVVGSFLNVVVLRHGVRSIGGRSGCMSCGTQLRWYDMLPVFSWLVLGGRCRTCHARISLQYPFVEATTGVLFGFVGASSLSVLPQVISCLILALLVAISVYDLRHTIIPDEWAYAFAGLAFVSQFLLPFSGEFNPWWFIFAGPVAGAPLFALWLFSGGRWMGLGDAKLALGIGWLLGPALGIFAVFGAFVIGAIVSVPLVLFSSGVWRGFTPTLTLPLRLFFSLYNRVASVLGKEASSILIPNVRSKTKAKLVSGFTMKSEIPFGPFLIFSCIIIWFATLYGIDPLEVFGLSLSLNSWQ